MGFNKRYFNESIIRNAYQLGGVLRLQMLMKKTDAALCEDEYSCIFVKTYRECCTANNFEKLEQFLCQ